MQADKQTMQFQTRALLCALTLSMAGAAGAAEPMPQIFSKVAAAYGGPAPTAMVETGTTTSFIRGPGSLLRQYQAPDRFRIEINYATGSEVRAMAGDSAWMQGKPSNPTLRGAVALQAARMALPWNMLARQDAAVDRGELAGPEGKSVRVVELALEDKLKLVVEIDPDSGHILRSRGIQSIGSNTMEFATGYSDFKTEGGRTYAAHEEHYAMGQHTGYSNITKIDYPAALPDSVFIPR